MNYSEVVKTVYLDPIEFENDDGVHQDHYKVEIIRNQKDEYRVLLFHSDLYTVKPSSYKDKADETLWIFDEIHQTNPDTIVESSAERALQVLIERLSYLYCKTL